MLSVKLKIITSFIYVFVLFFINTWIGYGIIATLLLLAFIILKVPFYEELKLIKNILPILIFTAIVNMFFIKGTVIFSWNFIKITSQGIEFAIKMVMRVMFLVVGSSLLTYTTTPFALADGIKSLMKPLNKVGFPVHEFSMILTIGLRFIPILEEETKKITIAQKSRGAEIDSKNIFKRITVANSIIVPLLISILRRSEQIAIAMESRCYSKYEKF